MEAYIVWITATSSDCQDGLISGLVKRGYTVKAADVSGRVITSSSPLIALLIGKEADINARTLFSEVSSILSEIKTTYHSIIVSIALSTNACWGGSNLPLIVKNEVSFPQQPISKELN